MTELNPYQSPEGDLTVADTGYEKVRFFSSSQRIGRVRYLAYNGVAGIILMALLMLFAGGEAFLIGVTGTEGLTVFSIVMVVLYYLVSAVVSIMLGVRRLHDLEKSGWFYLLFLVPFVNLAMAIYLVFFPGSKESNKFGRKPESNTPITWICGLILPMVAMIGILAAIALPAYQDYVDRAQLSASQYSD